MNSKKPRQPCSGCGRVPANSRSQHCPFCDWNFRLELLQWQERVEEEQRKWLRLHKLRLALSAASRYLNGFDMTEIDQAINNARPVRAVQADDKEKTNAA